MRNTVFIAATIVAIGALPAGADQAAPGTVTITPEVLATILRLPQGSKSTYEDLLAALARPVRFYDFNGDGLSRDEIDAVTQVRAQDLRVSTVGQILRFDLNNDRQVTHAEFDMASRIALANGNGSLPRQLLDRADTDRDGIVTLEEMLTLQPDQKKIVDRDTGRIAAVTVAIDPTPDTNFTLDDAHTLIDAVFATYDTDKNGLLDQTELRAARPDG